MITYPQIVLLSPPCSPRSIEPRGGFAPRVGAADGIQAALCMFSAPATGSHRGQQHDPRKEQSEHDRHDDQEQQRAADQDAGQQRRMPGDAQCP